MKRFTNAGAEIVEVKFLDNKDSQQRGERPVRVTIKMPSTRVEASVVGTLYHSGRPESAHNGSLHLVLSPAELEILRLYLSCSDGAGLSEPVVTDLGAVGHAASQILDVCTELELWTAARQARKRKRPVIERRSGGHVVMPRQEVDSKENTAVVNVAEDELLRVLLEDIASTSEEPTRPSPRVTDRGWRVQQSAAPRDTAMQVFPLSERERLSTYRHFLSP